MCHGNRSSAAVKAISNTLQPKGADPPNPPQSPVPGRTLQMLYSGPMNRILSFALVACMILFIIAILISPVVDLQPSALRAQQWLILIVAMFSLAVQLVICLLKLPVAIGPPCSDIDSDQRVCLADLACCLRC